MRARTPYKVFRVAALVLVVLALLAPLAWMVAASLKTNVDIYNPDKAIFFTPTWDNYDKVLQQANYVQFIVNSLWVAFAGSPRAFAGMTAAESLP